MLRRALLALLAPSLAGTAFVRIGLTPAKAAAPASVAGARFDHVSLNVRDFDRALAWYQGKLGFRVDVAWRVTALNGKRLAYLSMNDTRLELVEADRNGAGLPPPMSFPEHFGRTGYGHLCFGVESVDAALEGLASQGVEIFVKADTYDLDGTPYRRRVGFVKDFEGNVLEFGEPLQRL